MKLLFGIPKETKIGEYRVAVTPDSTRELVTRNQSVLIQSSAGEESGYSDDDYRSAGCQVADSAAEIWDRADLVVKVKEPQPSEYGYFRKNSALFTFLHLAADIPLANALLEKSMLGIAYETVRDPDMRFPILAPMSAIAGQLAVHAAGHYLQRAHGGLGKLISRVQGAPATDVVVIGAGTVGQNAAQLALAFGANLTLINDTKDRLDQFAAAHSGGNVRTLISTPEVVEEAALEADVVIGAVYSPGRRPPVLMREDQVERMRPGSVIVDVAVDQGGCFATTHPTTYEDPAYITGGVVHYAVANMPGAVPRTATAALASATLPYLVKIAELGMIPALTNDEGFAAGVSTFEGRICDEGLAEIMDAEQFSFEELVALR